MIGPLNRSEVEEAGEIIVGHLTQIEAAIKFHQDSKDPDIDVGDVDDMRHRAKRLRGILRKMDYPEPEQPKE